MTNLTCSRACLQDLRKQVQTRRRGLSVKIEASRSGVRGFEILALGCLGFMARGLEIPTDVGTPRAQYGRAGILCRYVWYGLGFEVGLSSPKSFRLVVLG